MPPLAAGHHLLELLFEIGPTKPAGMGGQVGIDETDLLAWQSNQGIGLTAWECRTIRALSRDYASMLADATDRTCAAPYVPAPSQSPEIKKRISQSVESWLDNLDTQTARR